MTTLMTLSKGRGCHIRLWKMPSPMAHAGTSLEILQSGPEALLDGGDPITYGTPFQAYKAGRGAVFFV
jgi:hypothetical protein